MANVSKQTELIMKERSQVSFNIEEMTNILDGSVEETTRRREMVETIQSDSVLGEMDISHLTPKQKGVRAVKKALRLAALGFDFQKDVEQRLYKATAKDIELTIHMGPFISTIQNLGTPEQVAKWIPLAKKFYILGTYAQTELGHGSNLRGLETTATFDPGTQEFVMNSPMMTSMKWWPGDLAKMANHAVVMGNLIVNKKKYGMHPFIVQIRDLDTHMPLPGVKVGDIGEKIEESILSNGFLRLNHVRIPRENMLAALSEVLPDGTYQQKGDQRVMYSSMLILRVDLVDPQAIYSLQITSTIAARYSVVRTQGSWKRGDPEIPVLDYVTQQRKILPNVAAAYAFEFSSRRTRRMFNKIIVEVQNGNYKKLPEIHALVAGMKSYLTEKCLEGSETCRRACGGHGYLKASGFSRHVLGQMASVTYDGENTVMYLQCARYLVKSASEVMSGQKLLGVTGYLCDPIKGRCLASSEQEIAQPAILLECFKQRAYHSVMDTAIKMQKMETSGIPPHEAWNKTSVDLVKMVKVHLDFYVISSFVELLRSVQADLNTKRVLADLCSLWGLYMLNENVGDFLKDGFLSADQASMAREAEVLVMARLRPDAVGLVDAFDYTDKTLQSCIGTYDGNVYERLYENAKRSPRNQSEIDEECYEILRPYLHKGRDILQGGPKSRL